MGNIAGLRDAVADGVERRSAFASALALLAVGLALTPVATRAVPYAFPPLLGLIVGASVIGTAITSAVLFVQARTLRSLPTSVLAAGFCFAAAMMLLYAIVYPGLLIPAAGLVHATRVGLLWYGWHAGLLASMIAFDWLRRSNGDARAMGRRARAAVIGLTAAYVVLTACAFSATLPPLADSHHWTPFFLDLAAPVMVGLAAAVVVAALRRGKAATVLDLWLAVVAIASIVDLYLMVVGAAHYTIGWYASRIVMLAATIAVLGALLRAAAATYAALVAHASVLESEAHTDTLTGLPNRRRFDEQFARAFGSTKRRNGELAIAIIDIDRFKRYNDAFGHQAGDDALHAIGQAIGDSVRRSGDFAARYGGEEFVVILEDTTLSGTLAVAEQIRAAVIATGMRAPSGGPLTVSIGVALRTPDDASADDLLRHADEALYLAKDAGRNRVVPWTPPPRSC